MSWGKLDDRYDDHRKIRRAWKRERAAVGLHAMAITYCARNQTDGKVDIDWLEDKLPTKRERDKIIATLVDLRLFDELDSEHWLVHDYLDYNDSAEAIAERRRKDAQRKAGKGRQDSKEVPEGFQAESDRSPLASHTRADARGPGVGVEGSSTATSKASLVDDARAQIGDSRLDETAAILKTCPRLQFDPELMGVANTLAAHPAVDHRKAAHLTVTNASDPNYRTIDAGRALHYACAQLEREAPRPFAGAKPTAESEAEKWARREREWKAEEQHDGERVA